MEDAVIDTSDTPGARLFGRSLPDLLQGMEKYHARAAPLCSPEQTQLLAEVSRRIKQCRFLLENIAAIEQRQFEVSLDVLAAVAQQAADANQRFEAQCQEIDVMRLFTESYYWIAHKVIAVIVARQANFSGKRLPSMPKKIPHGGVTNVRNHLIEHPYDYSETFSIGGMRHGPVLNGGLGKDSNGNIINDPGLYHNAIEWAETLSGVLEAASNELRGQAQP